MGQQCPVPAFARVPQAKGLVSSVQGRFLLPCHSADMAHIKMDPAKVKAVTYWPVPGPRKNLQRFLRGLWGFCQILPSLCPELQLGGSSPNNPHLPESSIPMVTSSRQGIWFVEGSFNLCPYSYHPRSFSPVHCEGGCLGLWS